MKISEVIDDYSHQTTVDNVDWNWLMANTRQYRESVRAAGKWLLRGVKNKPDAYQGRSRTDRIPEHSHMGPSLLFDYALAHHFHASALRLNSVFCTSNTANASMFGKLYVMFPLDRFQYTYTTDEDMVLKNLDDTHLWREWKFDNWFEQVMQQAEQGKPDDAAWLSNNIATYFQDPYTLFERWLPMHAGELTKMGISAQLVNVHLDDFLSLDEFARYYQPKTTDLASALTDGVEVYIRGNYMALHLETYGEKIQEHFRIETP